MIIFNFKAKCCGIKTKNKIFKKFLSKFKKLKINNNFGEIKILFD